MRLFALLSVCFLMAACSSKDTTAVAKDVPLVTKVSRETYLTGDQFCEKYSEITQKEFPLRVSVPKIYANPSLGNFAIYAYTTKPFDKSKPSYIYVDGGPGQNTHGLMRDYLGGDMNEIRFDQRGLGCSAPLTFEEYKDQRFYSSRNNIRDLDLIREAYGLEKWAVYGVSYGTVPATMYASQFAGRTTSVVLEGVLGDALMIADPEFRAGKLNLVLWQLTENQRNGFASLMYERTDGSRSADSAAFQTYMYQFFYSDKGMSKFAAQVSRFINDDGSINRAGLATLRERMRKRDAYYPLPQQPGAVDSNIMGIIYCKDLSARERPARGISYGATGFYVRTYDQSYESSECDDVGVTVDKEEPFRAADYTTSVSTYYFQGAHDGATIAAGAYKHWQVVPQAKSYFMLAEKGGHNPNLTRLDSDVAGLRYFETTLFEKALMAGEITQDDVSAVNAKQPLDEAWDLHLSKTDSITDKLGGMHLTRE